ncbi:hypothetical protein IU447_13430 [Nocardia farcinica]|uniref:Uncharacterized protein n=1 Tax=Nocardia farcinica TaxID=37329 RepID=A0A449GN95_NOCFR|nr:hypothetical protein [Nocardia farcinica]MBF6361116.1 hypothetical protein [Nocardia farcinica]PFW98498.1 hypothetical protein CJ469_06180 [Nocardia farcinica]PFX08215.1 hypothetical protein CJ468_02764 [Nocardia farcinica]VFA94042.1 Uncharacterised protein [Nocardia farcinica]
MKESTMTTSAAKKTTAKSAETLPPSRSQRRSRPTRRRCGVFLRASDDYEVVGSGARYSFTTKNVGPMKTRFMKWTKEREATKAAKKAEAEAAHTRR